MLLLSFIFRARSASFAALCGAFLLISAAPAQAARRVCGAHVFESKKLKYCIDFGNRTRNHDLLYILHGSNGTESDWIQAGDNRDIQRVWDQENIAAPTKITISFGDEWWFVDRDLPESPSLQRLFVQQVIPYLERRIPGRHGRRLLKGVSMGGWNGAQLLLKNSSLFSKVALICPVIATVGPFSTDDQIGRFIKQNEPYANESWIHELIEYERETFATPADWLRHDPLTVILTADIQTPEVYVSCANHDQFGFFEGTEAFVKLAIERGVNVTWQPTEGGHCVIDAPVVAHFFTD